ncbi:MAG: AarF/UbiB family protein, partial [bacterium]
MPTKATSHRAFRRRFRLIKIYGVTSRILISYLLSWIAGLLRGPDWVAHSRPALHQRNAQRAVRTILDLKGLFIKVGQLISILTNFLPEDFRHELEKLQDQIPPRPLAEIHSRIRAELGEEPAELFEHFESTPIASASLAQVHEARLHDGRRVAVKVQHVEIEEIARLDLKTIRNILSVVGAFVRVRGLNAQFVQIQEMIR